MSFKLVNFISLVREGIVTTCNKDFYQVSTMRESVLIEDTDLQIISVYIRLDSNYDEFSRRVYSFGDLLGQTGGLYSAMFIAGSVMVAIFTERLFVSSILKKIYQIDEARDVEMRKYIKENKGKIKTYQIAPELENCNLITLNIFAYFTDIS